MYGAGNRERQRPGQDRAIIAPGGGFAYVASVHEGFPYAINTDWSRQMPNHIPAVQSGDSEYSSYFLKMKNL